KAIRTEEVSTSDDEVDASFLESLLRKAKSSAPKSSQVQVSYDTKAFSNGKFKDPIGDLVKENLYIQDVSTSHCTTEKPTPALSSYSSVKLIEPSREGELSQALAIDKLKGVQELKMNFGLAHKPSKAERVKLKASNAGDKWFNLPAPVMTPELKRDLELLSLRNVLDRKRFYKKSDRLTSKFLQVGTIIEDKSEFYSARLSKKERQSTMVGEVLNDTEAQEYFKSRFDQIQQAGARNARAPSQKRFKKRSKH
ncbi:dTDP-fucopyranose mutase, partial [Massospora cicadina]